MSKLYVRHDGTALFRKEDGSCILQLSCSTCGLMCQTDASPSFSKGPEEEKGVSAAANKVYLDYSNILYQLGLATSWACHTI